MVSVRQLAEILKCRSRLTLTMGVYVSLPLVLVSSMMLGVHILRTKFFFKKSTIIIIIKCIPGIMLLELIGSAANFFFSWLSVKVIWIKGIVCSGSVTGRFKFSPKFFPCLFVSELFDADSLKSSSDAHFLVGISFVTFGGDVDFAFVCIKLPIGPR